MKMKWILPLCGMLLATPDLLAKHYKLFVLTGQSNSLGTTNGGEADPTSGSDPADQHVIFSWHNVVSASTSIGHSGETLGTPTTTADFTTLQDQQGGVYGGSATHWGGEIEFARSLYRAGVRDFGVIKASRGGGGNTNWHKASSGHMYQHILDTVGEAVASLDPGDTYEIVGLMYLQGESDNSAEAAAAGTRLKELTDNLRADLTNAASMHTVAAGTTAAGDANDATSRANQAAIATSTSYIDYFDNTDLQVTGLGPDGLHLNKNGKEIVGRRWAQAFLNAGVVDRHYGKLVFIGDSITQGGNGNPSYRYQVFTNLANAGVSQNASTGYEFVGSQSGAYQSNPGSTPDVNGQTFVNQHEGHWGWRVFWSNARVALPAGRYNTNNLGNGTLENWTGQTTTYDTANAGTLTYTGTTYVPDTAVIKMGINDTGSSSATQIRDDLSTLIDQLRAANANVRIHLCEVLYSDNVAYSTVDSLNALLPALVDTKNAASTTSPVWLIDANNGFDPGTMTYDNTHPNASGEAYVGNRISGGLSIIELPQVVASNQPAAIAEKATEDIGCYSYEGSDIYNSGSFASNWSADGSITATPEGASDIKLVNPGAGGSTLNGTNTGWSDINGQNWVFETRIKFNDITNGFIFWLGTGSNRVLVECYPDRTQDNGAGSFNVAHNNHDGEFHTFKISHDPTNSVYHVWRDDVLLTSVSGAGYDATASDGRLLMGDYTSGSFGNNFDVTIDYVNYCVGYKGNQIYDGSSYINGWSNTGSVTPTIVDTDDLQIVNPGSAGTWIEGTNTGWSSNNSGNWTFEMRAKINDAPNGFLLWFGTGNDRIYVAIYNDRTEDEGANTFTKSHTNNDGAYHTWRVTHDSNAEVYHVFRDGERLTPNDGVAYDTSLNDSRLILGDFTGGSFGDNFDVTIDCVNIDYSGVWIPEGTDTDGDGMSDLWESQNFNGIEAGAESADSDNDGKTNLEEFHADTDPNDATSSMEIIDFSETMTPGTYEVTVTDTKTTRVYTLYESDDMGVTDPWAAVAGQGPVAGNGGDLIFSAANTEKIFYRVGVDTP